MNATVREPMQRMQNFAKFFRGYMGAAPVIAAAMPIPIAAGGVIPVYPEMARSLTAYSSMFCFLGVAFIFYRRHRLGAYLVPERWTSNTRVVGNLLMGWAPLALMFAAMYCILTYHQTLARTLAAAPGFSAAAATGLDAALKHANLLAVPAQDQLLLFLLYLGIFLSSTLSFALMAVREYMQTELGLTEEALVHQAAVTHQPAQRTDREP